MGDVTFNPFSPVDFLKAIQGPKVVGASGFVGFLVNEKWFWWPAFKPLATNNSLQR